MKTKTKIINWHIEKRKVSDLKVWNKNPRVETDINYEMLVREINDLGFRGAITIDTDNTIVAGHRRRKAMYELGRENEEVDCLVPDQKLSKYEFERIAIGDNKFIGEFAPDILTKHFDVDFLLNDMKFDSIILSSFDNNTKVSPDIDSNTLVIYTVKINEKTRTEMHLLKKAFKLDYGIKNNDEFLRLLLKIASKAKLETGFVEDLV